MAPTLLCPHVTTPLGSKEPPQLLPIPIPGWLLPLTPQPWLQETLSISPHPTLCWAAQADLSPLFSWGKEGELVRIPFSLL